MSEGKVGLNKWGNPSKTGKDWNEQAGRFGKPENAGEQLKAASAGGKAKAVNIHKRKAIEAILKDKQSLLDDSVADVLEESPEIISKIMKNLAQQGADGDLKAAAIFLEFTGIKAPSKTEAVVEDKRTVDQTVSELELLGVNVSGLKVVK